MCWRRRASRSREALGSGEAEGDGGRLAPEEGAPARRAERWQVMSTGRGSAQLPGQALEKAGVPPWRRQPGSRDSTPALED